MFTTNDIQCLYIRELAIKNQFTQMGNSRIDVDFHSGGTFEWVRTPEGVAFWSEVEDGKILTLNCKRVKEHFTEVYKEYYKLKVLKKFVDKL